MKKTNIAIAIFALLLVLAGGLYFNSVLEQEKIASEKVKQEQLALEARQTQEMAEQKRTKCVELENHTVVTYEHENSVGQDILLKDKGAITGCKYEVVAGDLEIKNQDAEYFKDVQGNALITDVGTGPTGRSFRLYDLNEKKLLTEKKYFDELNIIDSKLEYFGLSKTKADAINCKDYKTFMKEFGNANIAVKKIVDLKTFLVKETRETMCVANQ